MAGKDDLILAAVADVVPEARAYLEPLISAEPTGPGALRAYIESSLAFMAGHRNHLIAIVEIGQNARRGDGSRLFDNSILQAAAAELTRMLARLQAAGELRPDFDPAVLAAVIRAAIDTVPPRLALDPASTPSGTAGLADLFVTLATRREGSSE